MSLPTLSKTWQYNVNQAISSGTAAAVTKAVLLALKNTIKGFPLAPYVVRGSGNTVAGGMDGVDRWTTSTDLVSGGGGATSSWIVLRQTGVGVTFDLLMLFDNSFGDDTRAAFLTSSAGFTGGSAGARPTATDEMSMAPSSDPYPGTSGILLTGVVANHRLHVLMSSDGASLRWMVYCQNAQVNCGAIDRMTLPSAGVNYTAMHGQGVGWLTVMSTASTYWTVRLGSARQLGRLTKECINGGSLGASTLKLGTVTDTNILSPLGVGVLASDGSNTQSQRCGTLTDMWETTDTLPDTTTFPLGTARTFCKFGGSTAGSANVVLPWNGSIPLTA